MLKSIKCFCVVFVGSIAGILCACEKEPAPKKLAANNVRLAFVLAAHPAYLSNQQIEDLRQGLVQGNFDSPELRVKWVAIQDMQLWTDNPDEVAAIDEDPFAAFLPTGRIVDRHDGRFYLLTYRTFVPHTEVLGYSKTQTSLGYPAIQIEMSDAMKVRLRNMLVSTNPNWVAVIWEGKVVSTSSGEPWLRFNNFSTGGRERDKFLQLLNDDR